MPLDRHSRTVEGRSSRSLSSSEAVSLREFIEARLLAHEQAVEVASRAMERRLDGMNEFQETLRDQAARFVTRDEVDLQLRRLTDLTAAERAAIREQLAGLQSFRDRLDGKASAKAVFLNYGLSVLGLILAIIGLLLR